MSYRTQFMTQLAKHALASFMAGPPSNSAQLPGNSIQSLREQLAEHHRVGNQMLASKGSRNWNTADQAKFDAAMDEAERVQSQIEAHERLLNADAARGFNDARRLSPMEAKQQKRDVTEGFDIFLRKSQVEMSAEDIGKVRQALVKNTMSTSTGSEGGFSVQPMVARTLIDALKAYGFMRGVADNITTDTGADLSYPGTDGTNEIGEMIAQNATASASDATFFTRPLNAYKYGSKVFTIPIELLQDSAIDIQSMVFTRARDRIGRAQNSSFTIGSGSGMPFGVLASAGAGVIAATGYATTIAYDHFVDLVDTVDIGYLNRFDAKLQKGKFGPGFMFGQQMRRYVRKIKDTTGRPIWTPSYELGASAATPDRLLGYPVYINNDMPAPAPNAKSVAFGDFSQYMVRDVLDMVLYRFDDAAYMTRGQVGFLAWARAGGNLLDVTAVKTFQHSAS